MYTVSFLPPFNRPTYNLPLPIQTPHPQRAKSTNRKSPRNHQDSIDNSHSKNPMKPQPSHEPSNKAIPEIRKLSSKERHGRQRKAARALPENINMHGAALSPRYRKLTHTRSQRRIAGRRAIGLSRARLTVLHKHLHVHGSPTRAQFKLSNRYSPATPSKSPPRTVNPL